MPFFRAFFFFKKAMQSPPTKGKKALIHGVAHLAGGDDPGHQQAVCMTPARNRAKSLQAKNCHLHDSRLFHRPIRDFSRAADCKRLSSLLAIQSDKNDPTRFAARNHLCHQLQMPRLRNTQLQCSSREKNSIQGKQGYFDNHENIIRKTPSNAKVGIEPGLMAYPCSVLNVFIFIVQAWVSCMLPDPSRPLFLECLVQIWRRLPGICYIL